MSSPPSQASVPTVSGEKGCGESSGKPQPSDTLGIHVGSMDLPQRGRVAVHAPMVGGWRGTHGTRRPGAPSRQAAGPAPFYMLGEMGIPFLLIKKKTKNYLFLPVLGLHCYTWAFFSCSKQGVFSVAVCRASHCGGFSCGARALEHSLRSFWVGAQLLHGMWDLPGLGMEPVSPHTLRQTLNHWTAREALLIFSTLKECLKRIVVSALRLGSSHS